jgi:hypothetical protein
LPTPLTPVSSTPTSKICRNTTCSVTGTGADGLTVAAAAVQVVV